MEIIGIAKIVGNKNLSIALSTLLLKYRILISLVISFGSIGTSSNNLDILLVWYSQLLGQTKDNEILLRLLAGAGTLILQQPTAKSCLNIAILKQTLQSLPQSSVYDIKLAQNHLKSMI